MPQLNIGVLISGGGTNLQSIIDNINNGNINAKISLVISNKQDAYGLERAKNNNIETLYIDYTKYNDINKFNDKIIEHFKEKNVDLVVLAGYLKILTKKFVKHYNNKIINIHPSLIPSFCGKGYYGLKVHQAVIDYGVKITGATVHFVDENADTGPIIMQDIVHVANNDTAITLQKKVLKKEHSLLPKVIALIADDKIIVKDRKVIIIE